MQAFSYAVYLVLSAWISLPCMDEEHMEALLAESLEAAAAHLGIALPA